MTPEETFKIDEIEKAINQYELDKAGLPELKEFKAPTYLFLAIDDLKRKSPDELSEASYLIAQYSMYIQRLINKNKSWINWGRSRLRELTADHLEQMPLNINSFERTMMAENRPDICRKLNAFLRKINMEHDRLYGIPDNIKIISDAIRDIKFTLLRKKNEQ